MYPLNGIPVNRKMTTVHDPLDQSAVVPVFSD